MAHQDSPINSVPSFFDSIAMIIYDYHTLQIFDVNDAAIHKYGFKKNELLEKKITDLGEKFHPSRENGEQKKSNQPSIWIHKDKQGNPFHVQLTLHSFKQNGKTLQLALVHDVSEIVKDLELKKYLLPRIDALKAQIPMGMIEWGEDGKIRDWSDYAQHMFGYSFKEMAGKSLLESGILPGEKITEVKNIVEDFIAANKTYFTIDARHNTKRGEAVYCTWHNAVIYDQAGKPVSIYSMVEDTTLKMQAREKLKESEQRFRVLSESSLVGVYMVQDRKFKYANPRLCEIMGYEREDLVDKMDPFKLVHHDDLDKLKRLRKMWFDSEIDSFEVDIRAFTRNGEMVHVKVYGSKILMNQYPAVIGVVVDQTRQVETHQKFKESVESYKDLFDTIGDAIYILDEAGIFIEVNHSVEEMYGYSKADVIGEEPSMLSAPGKVNMDETMERFSKALHGEPQRFEWWGKRKNGEIFPKELHLNPGMYFGKKVVIAIAIDISEQHEQQETLKQNEQLFRQLFQNSPIGIALLDQHKEVQMINQGFEEIFGYSFDEVKGLNIDSIIASEEQYEEAFRLSSSEEAFEISTDRVRKDGSLVNVLIYGVPVVVNEKTIAIYGIYVDITDRKEAENKIRNSLKEKEVLLSEIHHRVKNNLAVITGLLELQSQSTESETAKKVLKDSQMRINSMALVHEKLYQNETLSRINFDIYIRELVDVIRNTLNSDFKPIELSLDIEPIQFPITQAIPCGLLLNEVITNSFKHAFPETLKHKPVVSISLKEKKGDIHLQIGDNGVGLPEKFEELGSKSLGITLIDTLRRQIEASISINSVNGTTYDFRFRKEIE